MKNLSSIDFAIIVTHFNNLKQSFKSHTYENVCSFSNKFFFLFFAHFFESNFKKLLTTHINFHNNDQRKYNYIVLFTVVLSTLK